MEYRIERAGMGDEMTLAYIQTESWKSGFKGILPDDILERCTQADRVSAMYRRSLEQNEGNGYILHVDGQAHCIAWWDAAREKDMAGYAELFCIHSLQNRWRQGFGTRMMERVLRDMAEAGYRKVMLWVFEENIRVRRFYEANGFVNTGRMKIGIEPVEICYEKEI